MFIRNRSGAEATYVVDAYALNGQFYHAADTLGTKAPNNESIWLFGFGWAWTDSLTESYARSVERIELRSLRDTVVYDSFEEVHALLARSRRPGLMKKNVVIFIR